MRRRCALTLTVSAALIAAVLPSAPAGAAADPPPVAVPYIVGGSDVTPADGAPWLVAILDGDNSNPYAAQFCTGSLISSTHVLTAGHCVKGADGQPVFPNLEVAVGILNLTDITASDRYQVTATAHPNWDGSDGVDLAILTLATPIADIEPLLIRPAPPGIGDPVTAYGWGGTKAADRDHNTYPLEAQKGTMTVTTDYDSTTNCGYGPPDPTPEPDTMEQSHQFCFADPAQAVCFGDSGGPIVMFDGGQPYLVGATSQGPTICNLNAVDEIAERVIDSVPWIESYTGPVKCGWNPASAGSTAYPGWTVPCWLPPADGASIPFLDVNFDYFYVDGIEWLWSNTITTGTSATAFSPDDPVTRGEVAAFLWRFADQPAASGQPYADVVKYWQIAPVAWLDTWGFTTGTTPTTFAPEESVSRAQLVTFIWRLIGKPAPTTAPGFPDVAAGQFYTSSVAWAAENGITTGYPDGTFGPDKPVTRGEVATFLYRLALLVEAQGSP